MSEMDPNKIVEMALKAKSFRDFQLQLELESNREANQAEAQRKFEAEAWRHFDGNKG